MTPSSSTMILYLLLTALILGVVESQTSNVTEEELSKTERNQTFGENSTIKPSNVTSSLYKDEMRQLEDELQSNQTVVFREDDENFQDQDKDFPGRHCHHDALVHFSHSLCGADFHKEMQSISTENWCILKNIISAYNNMTVCLEWLSSEVGCYYPNSDIQDFFLHIHSLYFQKCPVEDFLQDAPQGLVLVLTLIPVSLIPGLVYLVVWKSKVQE